MVRFFQISWRDKLLVIRIFLLLGVTRLWLASSSLRNIVNRLATNGGTSKSLDRARVMAHLVEQVSNHTWWQSNCLTRAVCCGLLFRSCGIPFKLHIGTRLSDGILEAHAWVTVCDETICGLARSGQYQEIVQFDSGSALLPDSFDDNRVSASRNANRIR
jgi:Transglutaminase-like superfamily